MKKIILTITAFLALTGVTYAGGIGIGATGSFAKVAADGKETTGIGASGLGAANTNSISVDESSFIGSVFVDFETDGGFVLGFSHVPGSADVSSKAHQRIETAQGISGTDAAGAVTRTAAAEVENFNTLYLEMPLGMFYAKAGWSQIDVITKENAVTSSGTYGNKTLDGYTLGAGINGSMGNFFTKTSVEYTDFDTLSLSSSTNNSISADLDLLEFKFGVGKRF
jgi:hypothetical protein